MNPTTVNELFFESLRLHDRPDRMLTLRDGAVHRRSSADVAAEVRELSLGLMELGVAPGDRVAILSYNRPEWALADYAALTAGAASVPIYSTLPADAVGYILRDSGAKVIFTENPDQTAKVAQVRSTLPALKHVVAMTGDGNLTWERLREHGRRGAAEEHRRRADGVREDDLATLIYTSGTTGEPKGVMLTHRNFVSNILATQARIDFSGADTALSFLPLSHIFQRTVDYALFGTGAAIAYARSVDAVGEDLSLYRPTVMAAVPRFYEKIRAKVLKYAASLPARRRDIFHWALSVGRDVTPHRIARCSIPAFLKIRHALANLLVLRKLRARTGGRIRFFISGGAALPREVNEFFWSMGLPIYEGYGLTETSPVITVNSPGGARLGTVGRAVPGVEVRIAADGEILVRGPNVMKGYYRRDDLTAEVIRDGWFCTGDIGDLADGFLRITDRKKDLFKTSGGKYICPQPIENALKQSPLIENAVVVGAYRKFASVLLVVNRDAVPGNGDLASLLQIEVDRVNATLARHETLKKFAVLPGDLSIDRGEITPTMKVKRKVVEERYKDLIEAMYAE